MPPQCCGLELDGRPVSIAANQPDVVRCTKPAAFREWHSIYYCNVHAIAKRWIAARYYMDVQQWSRDAAWEQARRQITRLPASAYPDATNAANA